MCSRSCRSVWHMLYQMGSGCQVDLRWLADLICAPLSGSWWDGRAAGSKHQTRTGCQVVYRIGADPVAFHVRAISPLARCCRRSQNDGCRCLSWITERWFLALQYHNLPHEVNRLLEGLPGRRRASSSVLPFLERSPILGTNYSEFQWLSPKPDCSTKEIMRSHSDRKYKDRLVFILMSRRSLCLRPKQ